MSASILIVDDRDAVRDLIGAWAIESGYVAIEAESAERAFMVVAETRVDLVLTDLKMPGMDGLSLAQRLLEEDLDRPVILMTAFGDLENARRALSLGVYEYLVKPIQMEDLEAAVKRALGHRRLVLENRAYQEGLEEKIEENVGRLKTANEELQKEILERRQIEEALREREEKFRTLVEHINEMAWKVDTEGCYVYCSPKVRDILGYDPEELLGKTPFDFIPPDEAERVANIFAEMVAEQKSFTSISHRGLSKDGRMVFLECSGVPEFDRNGNLVGYFGIDSDITERKQAEQEMVRLAVCVP